jgi:hypothetical protein
MKAKNESCMRTEFVRTHGSEAVRCCRSELHLLTYDRSAHHVDAIFDF